MAFVFARRTREAGPAFNPRGACVVGQAFSPRGAFSPAINFSFRIFA